MGTRSKLNWVVGCGAVAAVVGMASVARACMDYGGFPEGPTLAVMSDDPAEAKAGIEALRKQGPRGLQMLLRAYGGELRQQRENPGASKISPRLAAAIDAVAAQKDAAYSGLYWHTDIEKATAAARASGRPILSLRLLGRLDTEFSCANSRYFRTVLYANREVSQALQSRFVLHWQSVRPVPKVTIDMGDGRVIERTVTGNSVHYVLDAEGRPVDAIPGLYGAKAFLRVLDEAERAVRGAAAHDTPMARRSYLAEWHEARRRDTSAHLAHELREAGLETVPEGDSPGWAQLASLPQHREDARLDADSTALFRAKNPNARIAGRIAMTKAVVEDPLARMLANFQRSVAQDTVRNEYDLHLRIHRWFAGNMPETQADDVAALNEKVYAELFLTPSSDPWLGLVPEEAYSALEGDGVRGAAK